MYQIASKNTAMIEPVFRHHEFAGRLASANDICHDLTAQARQAREKALCVVYERNLSIIAGPKLDLVFVRAA